MKAGYTKKVNMLIGTAIVAGPAFVGAIVLAPGLMAHLRLVAALLLAVQVAFIAGCCFYASGKGYHPALGLLGLLYIPGLVALALLPDKHKGEDTSSGCLPTLLVIFLVLLFLFGPIIYFVRRHPKAAPGDRSALDRQLKESSVRLHTSILQSGATDLGQRIRAVDVLIRDGQEAGQAMLREYRDRLASAATRSKDDDIVLGRLNDHFAALAPAVEVSTAPAAPAAVPFPPAPAVEARVPAPVRVVYRSFSHPSKVAGFIYVDKNGDWAADWLIEIRDDRTWIIAEATKPGFFGSAVATGAILGDGSLNNFPGDAFLGAKTMWVAGDIDAFIGPDKLAKLKKPLR